MISFDPASCLSSSDAWRARLVVIRGEGTYARRE